MKREADVANRYIIHYHTRRAYLHYWRSANFIGSSVKESQRRQLCGLRSRNTMAPCLIAVVRCTLDYRWKPDFCFFFSPSLQKSQGTLECPKLRVLFRIIATHHNLKESLFVKVTCASKMRRARFIFWLPRSGGAIGPDVGREVWQRRRALASTGGAPRNRAALSLVSHTGGLASRETIW